MQEGAQGTVSNGALKFSGFKIDQVTCTQRISQSNSSIKERVNGVLAGKTQWFANGGAHACSTPKTRYPRRCSTKANFSFIASIISGKPSRNRAVKDIRFETYFCREFKSSTIFDFFKPKNRIFSFQKKPDKFIPQTNYALCAPKQWHLGDVRICKWRTSAGKEDKEIRFGIDGKRNDRRAIDHLGCRGSTEKIDK